MNKKKSTYEKPKVYKVSTFLISIIRFIFHSTIKYMGNKMKINKNKNTTKSDQFQNVVEK